MPFGLMQLVMYGRLNIYCSNNNNDNAYPTVFNYKKNKTTRRKKSVKKETQFNFTQPKPKSKQISVINKKEVKNIIGSNIDKLKGRNLYVHQRRKRNGVFVLHTTKELKNIIGSNILFKLHIGNIYNKIDNTKFEPLKNTVCPITFDNIKENLIKCSTCKNCFSSEAIKIWQKQHNTCPLCRSSLTDSKKYFQYTDNIYKYIKLRQK